MIVSFDWWLLVVGIVGGAGLVWLVIADFGRRDDDVAMDETAQEAAWIASAISEAGRPVDETTVGEVLRLHRAYLAAPVPDLDPVGQEPEPAEEPDWTTDDTGWTTGGPDAVRVERDAAATKRDVMGEHEPRTDEPEPGTEGSRGGPASGTGS